MCHLVLAIARLVQDVLDGGYRLQNIRFWTHCIDG